MSSVLAPTGPGRHERGAGTHTTLDAGTRELDPHDPSDPVAPSQEDAVVASASEVIGGPLGRHALVRRAGLVGALGSIVAAVVALVALGVVERAHCITAGWSTPDHFWHACYSDIPVVYESSGLAAGVGPFASGSSLAQALPTALLSWLTAAVVPGGTPLDGMRWYFGLWSVLVTILLVVLAAVLVKGQPRHPWRAAHLASPALPFLALVSFEVVPVALAGVGLVAWGRRRPVVAGVLLGLAVLARPWALFVVLAIVLVCVRTGARAAATRAVGAALATVVVSVAVLAATPSGLDGYTSWWATGAGYGSPWYLATIGGYRWNAGALSILVGVGWLAAALLGTVFALSLPRRPRVAEVALVMTVVAVLVGKAVPVQAGLWVVLLMAVVGVRWRVHLTWAGVEVAYFVAVWLHIAAASAPDRGLPGPWYAVFVVARAAAWGWVAVEVWRRAALRPESPVVAVEPGPEAAGADASTAWSARGEAAAPGVRVLEDDELAGPCAGRPDDTVVTFV